MMKKFIFSITLSCLFALTSCQYSENKEVSEPEQIVLRLANNHSENSPCSKSCRYFAEKVFEKSQGQIKILCYNDSNFGDNSSVLQQVQLGGIDFAEISCTTISEIDEEFNALALPYIYDDNEHMKSILEGDAGEYLLNHEQLEENNLCGLCWYASEPRNFYSPKNFENGIENLKIGIENFPVLEKTISLMGAVPVTMNHEQIFPSLFNNNTDIAEGTLNAYIESGYCETSPYVFLDEHCIIPEMLIISKSTLSNLNLEHRDIIKECAEESAKQQYLFLEEAKKNAFEEMENKNCTIIEPSDEQKEQFKEAVMPLKDEYSSVMEKISP